MKKLIALGLVWAAAEGAFVSPLFSTCLMVAVLLLIGVANQWVTEFFERDRPVRDLLVTHWTKGAFARKDGVVCTVPEGNEFNITGAIMRCYSPHDCPYIVARVRKALPRKYRKLNLQEFNDHPDVRLQDVLRVMFRAGV